MKERNHLELFQLAIRETYTEISKTLPITIDPNVNEKYFDKRKTSIFRWIDNKQAVDFKIRHFRHKCFIHRVIEKISQNDVVIGIDISTNYWIPTSINVH